jgi:hypothetical protein
MKTLKVAVLVAAISLSQNAFAITESQQEICSMIEILAKSIMSIRQSGTPLKTLMDAVDGAQPSYSLAIAAFDSPKFRVEANKKRAIDKFANNHYLICLKEFN